MTQTKRAESSMGYMVWGPDLIAPVTAITMVDGRIRILAEMNVQSDVTPDQNDTVTVIGTDGSQIAHRARLSKDVAPFRDFKAGEPIGLEFVLSAVHVEPA